MGMRAVGRIVLPGARSKPLDFAQARVVVTQHPDASVLELRND